MTIIHVLLLAYDSTPSLFGSNHESIAPVLASDLLLVISLLWIDAAAIEEYIHSDEAFDLENNLHLAVGQWLRQFQVCHLLC